MYARGRRETTKKEENTKLRFVINGSITISLCIDSGKLVWTKQQSLYSIVLELRLDKTM